MGRSARHRPTLLGNKLFRIRRALDLTQEEMLERLTCTRGLSHSSISGYELGTREPPLRVLLEYARIANIHLEVLADDDLDMPDEIPSRFIHEGVKRNSSNKAKRKK